MSITFRLTIIHSMRSNAFTAIHDFQYQKIPSIIEVTVIEQKTKT